MVLHETGWKKGQWHFLVALSHQFKKTLNTTEVSIPKLQKLKNLQGYDELFNSYWKNILNS
jgi:hypothetical protein